MLAPVEGELQSAAERCQEALGAPEFAGLDTLIADAPRSAASWFELLSRYDKDPTATATLKQMRRALPAGSAKAGATIERYIVLQALAPSAFRMASEPLPDTVKRAFASFCGEIAAKERQWDTHFDMEADPERFLDMAELATLRRFLVGAFNFAYERLALLLPTLNVHPLSLPGYIYQRVVAMPFTKPAIGPHLNYGRKQSLTLLQKDVERSLWLIAKIVEMNPQVAGINGWSWFNSKIVGEVYPHLAWIRKVYIEGGAYLIDTFPAKPEGYGFGFNNRKRQVLYEQGKFCPRQTAYFWPRENFLEWASRHPELVPKGEAPVQAPQHCAMLQVKSPNPAKHVKHNSPITLWNGEALLTRIGKLRYTALVLLLPAVSVSLLTLVLSNPGICLLTFPIWLYLAFSFQYFVAQ
jgi:hypothetical protein